MPYDRDAKRRRVTWLHRNLVNPVARRVAPYAFDLVVLETRGRRSGLPRHVPVTATRNGSSLWVVAEHGRAAGYVRNIEQDPRVRVRLLGGWRTGTALAVPQDDPHARLRAQPRINAWLVRMMGTQLLSVRIDLHDEAS